MNPELPSWTVPKSHTTNKTQIIHEDHYIFNNETKSNHQNSHSTAITKYCENKFSSSTLVHIVLSQIVLAFLYCDLGYLFGDVSLLLNKTILL